MYSRSPIGSHFTLFSNYEWLLTVSNEMNFLSKCENKCLKCYGHFIDFGIFVIVKEK